MKLSKHTSRGKSSFGRKAATITIGILVAALVAFLIIQQGNLPGIKRYLPRQETTYHDNGNIHWFTERDSNGNDVYFACYDEDGTLDYTREYAYWENNNLSQEKFTNYSTNSTITKHYSTEGILERIIHGDPNGLIDSETVCDENGNEVRWVMYDEAGNISAETIYDENGKQAHSVRYGESGNISSETVYDKNGNEVRWVMYDEAGNISAETIYDENGNKVRSVSYDKAGNTSSEELYEYDENNELEQTCSASTDSIITTYYRDGQWYKEIHANQDGSINFCFERSFDERGLVLSKQCKDGAGTLLAKWYYVDGKPQDPIWYTADSVLCIKILAACL